MKPSNNLEYEIRPGTIDFGKDYEYKITALLCLRCVLLEGNMWIACNPNHFGAFDDVVIHLNGITYMLQIKHKNKSKHIIEQEFQSSNGDFSITKYSNDICRFKDCTKSKLIKTSGDFKDVYFILFTNRGVTKYEFLEDSSCKEFLNTGGNVYKFNTNNNMYLYYDQVHIKHLNKLINSNIDNIAKHFNLINVENVSIKFNKYIQDWARGLLGGHYCLTKDDISKKLCELFLFEYALKDWDEYQSYDCHRKLHWNRIIHNKQMVVIEEDKEIVQFLMNYIGSELKKYVGEQTRWTDMLPKDKFYENFKHLKHLMLRIIGNTGVITLFDLYKCLWIKGEIPFIVKIDHLREYENLVNILKISNLKIIIIIKSTLELPAHATGLTQFSTMNDLNDEEQSLILQQYVKLQGRSLVKLQNVLNQSYYKYVKCKDLIKLFIADLSIDEECVVMPNDFIHRSLSSIIVKPDLLQIVKDETFFVRNSHQDIINPAHKIVHELILHDDGCLEWEKSNGSIKRIREYHTSSNPYWVSIEYLIQTNQLNRNRIISAIPGMGKSFLLTFISRCLPKDVWVLKINLHNYCNKYDLNINSLEQLVNKEDNLSKFIFRSLASAKKVFLLLDGFDEISDSYKEQAISMVKCLQAEGFTFWLTTRPSEVFRLEDELNLIANTLKPLEYDDQIHFLINYYVKKMSFVYEDIQEFVHQLLHAAVLEFRDKKFTSVPLHIKLLAEVFLDDCRQWCIEKKRIFYTKRFNLLYLYKYVVEAKTNILCDKYGKNAKDLRVFYHNLQKLLALKLIFPEVPINYDIDEFCNDPLKMTFLLREGIIFYNRAFNKYTIDFVHRTVAEYLAALWMFENFDGKNKEIVRNITMLRFTNSSYQFLFYLFDCMLAQNFPLHLSIINQTRDRTRDLIVDEPKMVQMLDKGGRSILHLLALNSARHQDLSKELAYLICVKETTLDVLDLISDYKRIFVEDTILKCNPLDYALNNRSLGFADKLCKKIVHIKIRIDIDNAKKESLLVDCGNLRYKKLFQNLLQYFVSRDLSDNRINENTTIESYCMPTNPKFSITNNLNKRYYDYIKEFKGITVTEYVLNWR